MKPVALCKLDVNKPLFATILAITAFQGQILQCTQLGIYKCLIVLPQRWMVRGYRMIIPVEVQVPDLSYIVYVL